MALTLTSLGAPASASTDTFNVASSTGATVGGFAKVDDEYSIITEIPNANSVVVRGRGNFGGSCLAHGALAPVVFGAIADIGKNGPGRNSIETAAPVKMAGFRQRSIGADGAVDTSIINEHTEFVVTKGSIAAITLNGNPTLAQDGLRLRFVAGSNFAHTITRTAGFLGGTATSSDVVTLSNSGSSAEFEARGGTWAIVSLGGAAAA